MFRSLTVYQLTIPCDAFMQRLPDALASRPFKSCTPKQASAQGWVSALDDAGDELVYTVNGGALFRLRTERKEVPSSWVKDQVAKERAKHEKAGKEFNKTDESLAKEAAIDAALPDTRPTIGHALAYVDTKLSMLFLGKTGDEADAFTEALGVALKGAAPLQLLGVEDDPCEAFTKWVRDPSIIAPTFALGRKGDIKHPGQEGGCGMINIKQEDLDDPEIVQLIDAGRLVCSVALTHELFSFRLRADLGFRSIQLSDYLKAEAWDQDAEGVTDAGKFAAFVPAMRQVMADLEPLLGGWPKQEVLDLSEGEAAA